MFGKIMAGVIVRDDQTLKLRIAEIETEFGLALIAERKGNHAAAEKYLAIAIQLEQQAFS